MASKMNKAKAIREAKSSGNKAMASGAFAKAARQYTKALELDPGNAILYSNRSAAHFNLRQFTESLEDAESAILCDNMWWKAYKRKGLSLIHMQRYDEAIEALEQGLRIVKKNAEMEKNLEFARACQEQAQNLYILPEPHMMQRLESVPVFIVTDDVGQPFFITYEDGQQVCTFYFDKVDANSTLDWIKTENPDLGDTARVIHITLNQAFNLAQETQKQYYEETTRAAVEEDRRAAMEEDARKQGVLPGDVDGSDEDKEEVGKLEGEDNETDANLESANTVDNVERSQPEVESEYKKPDGQDAVNFDDGIDDNAPLSFQFRPELRQVQVAVELLNKHPNPPVKPILRDPPSVRKAKSEAAATEAVTVEAKKATTAELEEGESDENRKVESEEADKSGDVQMKDIAKSVETEKSTQRESTTTEQTKCTDNKEEDEELTVDNFNGIPIFQAKGLTLVQSNEQLVPLFFSKWDLVAAWKQLKARKEGEEPMECQVEVGTLEDVLRRMSESKTKEFDNVFFVPSRESMKAIGAKFPLDDLAASRTAKPVVRKATFSKAKQIAARGGSKEEVRAAIKEDLELAKERQRMAEIIAQIEQARRLGVGVGGGMMDGRRRSGRIDRTMRRNAQRMAQKQAARKASRNVKKSPPPVTTNLGNGAGRDDETETKAPGAESPNTADTGKDEDSVPSASNIQVSSASAPVQQEPVAADC